MTILDTILANTREEVKQRQAQLPFEELRRQVEGGTSFKRPSFLKALQRDTVNIIAEVKKASPSRGLICQDFDPIAIARDYERGGAAAISVLTDERFFQGHLTFLDRIADVVELPLLRKDFIVDPYQIYEAKHHHASAVLLLANSLDRSHLEDLLHLTQSLSLDALIEVHNRQELESVLPLHPRIIGVNNRDLKTFQVDLQTSIHLITQIPENVIKVSESGIFTTDDIQHLRNVGYNAFLIGESLMKQQDRVLALTQLRGV